MRFLRIMKDFMEIKIGYNYDTETNIGNKENTRLRKQ